METEWSDRPRRGGGRGRGGQNRRRGGDRHYRHGPDGGEGRGRPETQGRGGSGYRGGRGGRREHRGRGAAPPPDTWQNPEEEDVETQEEQEEPSEFSRRRITSNWDRYKEPEKEAAVENDEPPRGTDYSVLLSSAGDSFSQFRFADEKEWQVDTAANTQMSTFFDCQAVAQSLQDLPLYLRLNLDAELVQVTVPTELPQFKITDKYEKKSSISQFRGQLGRDEVSAVKEKEESISSHLAHEAGTGLQGTATAVTMQKNTPAYSKAAGQLEEELEELLSLDAPASSGLDKRPSKVTARDKRSKNSANVGEKVETPAGKKKPSLPEPFPNRSVTQEDEEKLEDWLDSMIA